ncbi:site-2 protease family protein [candidate division WWE3 bacterium CG08_land_8_20_14_0_20_41_10]|uniref:Site-2 protease family protein n=1 Tax=candidate division WWE3 bacterium CG08_land_8_20_14_0_20_41_10 TaxID=1975085 RepID=A0A2H0XCH0_UNCKA|nr:MAG: site-2 protease family protein [candidate division WWE3 bacterium CG08_land_8_20_14_0_20_41_10]
MHGLASILFQNPLLFVVMALALMFSIAIHEFSHAYVANKLGDATAKNLGRLTLNPLAHLDPLGTLTLVLVGFGWGKAVPIDYYNLKNPTRDTALISLAGPASNFAVATALTILLKVIGLIITSNTSTTLASIVSITSTFIYPIILYNLVLGIFNLIPVEPLDGFKIVNGILPSKLAVQWVQLAPYGLYILILLMVTGTTSVIIYPVVNLFVTFLRL